jgi:hypothetical protein
MFKIGQKVVCVRPTTEQDIRMRVWEAGIGHHVYRGHIYTIRGIQPPTSFDRGVGVYLEEIINPISILWKLEYGYYADRFAPIQEKTTDISVFKEILDKVPEDA